MPSQIIDDLYREVRRLSIAGVKLSRNDFRLRNVLDDIEKIKDSSAVLQRLHSTGVKVLESSDQEIGRNFLEFSNLVVAVLSTQSGSQMDGEVQGIPNVPLSAPADVPYRKLFPVMQALTRAGGGRTRIIGEYIENDWPVDLRLTGPLIEALDGYFEIAEYSMQLLRKAGSSILPILEKSLDIRGHRGDARKLELICHFSGDRKKDLCTEALNDGSNEVRETAIKVLLSFKGGEKIIKEYARRQDKPTRENIANLVKSYKEKSKHP